MIVVVRFAALEIRGLGRCRVRHRGTADSGKHSAILAVGLLLEGRSVLGRFLADAVLVQLDAADG
ncbi:MAG: hypothetical protein WBC31_09905 [Candidatus Phosphoribacter baldrii]